MPDAAAETNPGAPAMEMIDVAISSLQNESCRAKAAQVIACFAAVVIDEGFLSPQAGHQQC